MIMTREEYEELKDSGDPAWETIEALRNVAKWGKEIATWLPKATFHEEQFIVALDALPGWIIEDGE